MPRRLLLLRHTAVSPRWRGTCYGRADAGLGREGIAAARRLAEAVPVEGFDRVVSSPARRARFLGGHLARRRGLPLTIEPLLAERDFGAWEGVSWDAIWRAEGNAMDGMLDAPHTYRPGGGETTADLAARVLGWMRGLPDPASVVAATHGGPIGALCGTLLGEPPRAWLARVPEQGHGALVILDARGGATVSPWPA